MPIYQKHYWGYSLFYYIAAKNDCHPNYVKYLVDKKTLSVKDVDLILERIEKKYKLRYSANYIETVYGEYIMDIIDDSECVEQLKDVIPKENILLLGPGKTIITQKDTIKGFIEKNRPVVIFTNFIPEYVDTDFIFISNPVRYSLIIPKLSDGREKIIGTSKVTSTGREFDYTVRYDSLISKGSIWDNSLSILLNLLKKIGVKKVSLAGFDGFTKNPADNYIDSDFDLSKSYSYLSSVNRCMTKMIDDIRRQRM